MPQAIQAKKKVPVWEIQNNAFGFSIPLRLLPPQLTSLTVFPGDDLDAKIPEELCGTLHTLCTKIHPSSDGPIDHLRISETSRPRGVYITDFVVQMKAGIRTLTKDGVREIVFAAIREREEFEPEFKP